MPTLVVASPTYKEFVGGRTPQPILYARLLAEAAHPAGWSVLTCDGGTLPADVSEPVVYVTTDLALDAARRLDVALLEPPLDLLARLPESFRRRQVEFATFADLDRLQGRTFVKPADPLDKWFDAGVYAEAADIRTRGRVSPAAPVLLSEPVEWTAEYRYFVAGGEVVAGSNYLAYGRPAWRPFDRRIPTPVPATGRPLVERLCAAMRGSLPPAFVVDVGVIEDRGWAVVEFNPAWSAGLLGADPVAVLPVLRRAGRPRADLDDADRRWVIDRPTADSVTPSR